MFVCPFITKEHLAAKTSPFESNSEPKQDIPFDSILRISTGLNSSLSEKPRNKLRALSPSISTNRRLGVLGQMETLRSAPKAVELRPQKKLEIKTLTNITILVSWDQYSSEVEVLSQSKTTQ